MERVKAATPISTDRPGFDECALAFLGSEFTGNSYIDWSIDRRLEAFLRHQGLNDLADHGGDFAALLDRVMVNLAKARRAGLLHR
jgi:hypothetical protein